jgi:hypothetical protein
VTGKVTLSSITEVGSTGVYTATLKGQLVDTFMVTPQFSGSAIGTLNDTVTLIAPITTFKDITVNGNTFASDSGFPSTGFKNAAFTLNMPAGKIATDYTWSSSQPGWVTVDNSGTVTFSNDASSSTKEVTITAKPVVGQTFVFTFTINKWFKYAGTGTTAGISGVCFGWGMIQPDRADLTNSTAYGVGGSRAVGNLWSEWGAMKKYTGWSSADFYYTSESRNSTDVWLVQLGSNGQWDATRKTANYFDGVCKSDL